MENAILDKNIISILDKIADIKRAHMWKVAQDYNLTLLQLQILQFIHNCSHVKQVSANDIVNELYISKATVSVALKALIKKGFVAKNISLYDKRRSELRVTRKAMGIIQVLEESRENFTKFLFSINTNDKTKAYSVLVEFVKTMQNKGVVDFIAMCLSCSHCKKIGAKRFTCTLTGRTFEYDGINVGCCNFSDKRAV